MSVSSMCHHFIISESCLCHQQSYHVKRVVRVIVLPKFKSSLHKTLTINKEHSFPGEREKCKEEVMYSLRKQHKRTMQELQNIREVACCYYVFLTVFLIIKRHILRDL